MEWPIRRCMRSTAAPAPTAVRRARRHARTARSNSTRSLRPAPTTCRRYVAATGWKPYDASKLDHLGFGKFRNVVTNVHAGADGGRGWAHGRPHSAPLRRQRAAHGGVRAMRRIARRESPALLLGGVLRRIHQARGLHSGSVSGDRHHHLLYRCPHARAAGGIRRARSPRTRISNWSKARLPRWKKTRPPATCW